MAINHLESIVINFVNKELVTTSNNDTVALYNNLRQYMEKFEEAVRMLEVHNPEQLWISINNDHLVIKCLDDMNKSQLVSILAQCNKNCNDDQYRYALALLHKMEFPIHYEKSEAVDAAASTVPSRSKVKMSTDSSTPFNRFDKSDSRFPWD